MKTQQFYIYYVISFNNNKCTLISSLIYFIIHIVFLPVDHLDVYVEIHYF